MPSTRTRRVVDEAGAEAVLEAAVAFAESRGDRVVVAVVEPGGELVALGRTAGAQVASSRVAVDKARTAAIFVRPSRELEEQVSAGRLGALALHGATALTGGVPLVVDGEVVGAVGTSGETPDEDEAVSLAAAATPFTTSEVPALTSAAARRIGDAIAAAATARGVAPVAAIVDAGGELVHLWRPDRAQVASVGVATDKARTAAIYRRPSRDFEQQASNGRPSALHLARAVPLQGGLPLVVDGQVVGAVGVSGASSADEDAELAALGVAAIAAPAAEAVLYRRAEVEARFATGGLLLDAGAWKLDAGRRTGPGEVELHARTVDLMHVVQGTATVVSGGELVDPREVAPGEVRAPETRGGVAHELDEGDVLAIPAGVPHRFVRASDPFLYLVVKVDAP